MTFIAETRHQYTSSHDGWNDLRLRLQFCAGNATILYLHKIERLDKLASVPRKVGGRNAQFCDCASLVCTRLPAARVTDSLCQPSWPVNSVEGGGLLHTSCFFLLCWHNRNYVPIWSHLNDSVNCELLIRTLIINHFKLCAFWKFVCFCKLWISEYSNMNKSRFVHCKLIPNYLM